MAKFTRPKLNKNNPKKWFVYFHDKGSSRIATIVLALIVSVYGIKTILTRVISQLFYLNLDNDKYSWKKHRQNLPKPRLSS